MHEGSVVPERDGVQGDAGRLIDRAARVLGDADVFRRCDGPSGISVPVTLVACVPGGMA